MTVCSTLCMFTNLIITIPHGWVLSLFLSYQWGNQGTDFNPPTHTHTHTLSLLYSYLSNPCIFLQLTVWPLVHTPIWSLPSQLPSQSLSPSLLDAPNLFLICQHWSLSSFHSLLIMFQWFPSARSVAERSLKKHLDMVTYPAAFSQHLLGGAHALRS